MGIAYNDLLVAPPLGVDTVQEAIDALKSAPGASPLLVPLDIYVSPTGLDTNSGLTPLLPVLTLAGAYSKITTRVLGAAVRIHIDTFVGLGLTPVPTFVQYNDLGQIILIGDGMGVNPAFQVVLAPTVSGALTTDLSIDFVSALADDVQGFFVEFTTGPAIGQRRVIRNNTLTAIIPDEPFLPAPVAGDSFTILAPNVSIDVVDQADSLNLATTCPLSVINILFTSAVGPVPLHVEGADNVKLYGCVFVDVQLSIRKSAVYGGMTTALDDIANPRYLVTGLGFEELAAAMAASPVVTTPQPLGPLANWLGWGVSTAPGQAGVFLAVEVDKYAGYVVMSGFPIVAFIDPSVQWRATLFGGFANGIILAVEDAELHFTPSLTPFLTRGGGAAQYALDVIGSHVNVTGGSFGLELDLSAVAVNTDGGIRARIGGSINWGGPIQWSIAVGVLLNLEEGASFDAITGTAVNNLLVEGGGLAWSLDSGARLTFQSDAGVPGAIAIATTTTCDGTVCLGGASVNADPSSENNPVPVTLTGPIGSIGGHVAANGGKIQIADGVVVGAQAAWTAAVLGEILLGAGSVSDCSTAFLSVVQSSIVATVDTAAGISGVGVGALVGASGESKITLEAATSLDVTGAPPGDYTSVVLAEGNSKVTVTGPILAANTEIGVLATINSDVYYDGEISGADAPTIFAQTNSRVTVESTALDSGAAPNVIAVSGGEISFVNESPLLTTTADAVNALGGGTITFADGITPVFAGPPTNELVVGISPGEQNPYATALPLSFDSYSNIGAGSSISRQG